MCMLLIDTRKGAHAGSAGHKCHLLCGLGSRTWRGTHAMPVFLEKFLVVSISRLAYNCTVYVRYANHDANRSVPHDQSLNVARAGSSGRTIDGIISPSKSVQHIYFMTFVAKPAVIAQTAEEHNSRWEKLWATGLEPGAAFDMMGPSPALIKLLRTHPEIALGKSVFVPGCG